MRIAFQLEKDDVLAMQRDVIEHSRTHRVKRNYFQWIISILLFAIILFVFNVTILAAVIGLIIALIFFTVAPGMYNKIVYNRLSRQIDSNDYTHLFDPCDMLFSEEGIDRIIAEESEHFEWSLFEDWHEDSHHYFLYVSDLEGLIVPKQPGNILEGASSQEAYQQEVSRFVTEKIEIDHK